MDLKLKGKTALVSGSTAGIGLAIATTLAREGARAIVNGRSQSSVDATVEVLRSTTGGDVYGFAGDLSQASSAEELARRHPLVDILVNNLGIFELKPFEEISDEDWLRFFDVNVLSGVRLARLFLPAMKRANWGRIIFISSESAVQIPGLRGYRGSGLPGLRGYRGYGVTGLREDVIRIPYINPPTRPDNRPAR